MAKKDGKKKKDTAGSAQQDAADAIRSAVERTLQLSPEGAPPTRAATREIVDEIASAAGRVRQTVEDLRLLDELKRLRTEVEALAGRVAALEARGPGAGKPASSASSGSSSSSRPAAAKSRAKSRAKRTTTRAKSAG